MNLRTRYQRFRQWQRQPYEVAPMSPEEHDCATCATHFQGNYCPRCGQSAQIGRYSFKKAFLLFLDVWGLGNRGMFRSLRDLMLRPGYMIRDYLSGMQMAYFPPFKMFFLLVTLSLLVTKGLNLQGRDLTADEEAQTETMLSEPVSEEPKETSAPADDGMDDQQEEAKQLKEAFLAKLDAWVEKAANLWDNYPNIMMLSLIVFASGVMYLFFRKIPAIPGLHYSEFLVGMVYIFNMISIYSIICDFLVLGDTIEITLYLTTPFIALRQLSDYSWLRTILSTAASLLIITALLLAFIIIVVLLLVYSTITQAL